MRSRSVVIGCALAALVAFVTLVTLGACGGSRVETGRDALVQVKGGEFHPGRWPDDDSGPPVAVVELARNTLAAGLLNEPFKGALSPSATAAAIALGGDRGYWIVPAGVPDIQAESYPSFDAPLSLASAMAPGDYALLVRAVDVSGRFGPATVTPITVTTVPLPDGKLVVSLAWDTEADLDLHVVDPSGSEVFNRHINSWQPPPPGQPVDPDAWKTGGILDFDSNAACDIDGRRQENVVWKTTAPSGHYVVRVDTFSMCAELAAYWSIDVRLDGAIVAHAQGSSFDSDTRFGHDRGAGVLAVELDVP